MENDGMIPAGYMYKTVMDRPDWLELEGVKDIYSVSGCISKDFFDDWINEWQHNGHWLFNSPRDMQAIAETKNVDLANMTLFFYYIYEYQWDEISKRWEKYSADPSFSMEVFIPCQAELQGYDVVTFYAKNTAECSPLSCNSLAKEIKVNCHCLIESLEETKRLIETGAFDNAEPGPMRIFAVYTVNK